MEPSIERKRKILVVGATGTVGREVVRALSDRGASVAALVRSEQRATALPDGVVPVVGDLTREGDVARVLDGVEAAFYVSPHIDEEESCARVFTHHSNARGIRLVFLGSHIDGASRLSRWMMRTVAGSLMPHYRPKFRLSERVRREANDAVLLVPSFFYQNDEFVAVRDALLRHHLYIQPVGTRGLNRVDTRDIGEAAARALLDRSIVPGVYPLVGPATLTGPQCAQAWGEAMGVRIDYRERDDLWEEGLRAELPARKFTDTVATCRQLKKFRVPTVQAHLRITTDLLGREPTDYATYVRRALSTWQTAASA